MTKNKEKDEKEFVEAKTILIGDSGVGKTCLIQVAIGEKFSEKNELTMSMKCTEKIIKIDSLKYCVNLWDTAGQEKYSKLNGIFYKGADIVIFVFDVTNKNSLDNLDNWIKNLEENISSNSKYVCGIIGNKKDLIKEQKVTEKDGKEYAKKNNMKFKMVSAKTDPLSFNKFLEELVKDAKNNLLNKKENIHLKEYLKIKKKCNC